MNEDDTTRDSSPGWPSRPPARDDAWDAALPYVPAPEPARGSKPRRRAPAMVAGALLIAGGAVFAATSLMGSDGASSPEAAADALFDAASDEDLLGVIDSLATGERDVLTDPVEDINLELQRLGILEPGVKLTGIPGVDLEFDDVEYEVSDLADGLAAVEIVGGTASATVIPDEVPIGVELSEAIEDISGEAVDIEADTTSDDMADADITLVAIDDDGWHISLGYSVAESARRGSGEPLPDFDAVQPDGADTPEGVVRELADAAAELDLRRAITLVDPTELPALHDYAPLFLDDYEDALAEEDDRPEVTISTLETSASVDGDVATVAITAIEATIAADGDSVRFGFDGECTTFEVDDGVGGADDEVNEVCVGETDEAVDDLGVPFDAAAFDGAGIVVHRVDGEWYAAPGRTTLDLLVRTFAALGDDTLDAFSDLFDEDGELDLTGTAFEDFFGTTDTEVPFGPIDEELGDHGVPTEGALVIELETFLDMPRADAACAAAEILAAFNEDELRRLYASLVEQASGPPGDVAQRLFAILETCAGS
jgi:hypothetical protein